MATRVERNATLMSLTTIPDLSEIANEKKSQCTYIHPLLDASNKASEPPDPSTSLFLEEKSKFGGSLRSTAMPTPGSRPRLFPKPYSKEKSSDTFANVKPPVTTFKSSSVIVPMVSVPRKPPEEMTSASAFSGNVPPLVDQKSIENGSKGTTELVTNMAFYSGPSANTVILFETASTDKSRASATQGKRSPDEQRTFGTVQTKEVQCDTKPETLVQSSMTSRKSEGGLQRQISLPSYPRPVSWNPCRSGEKKEASGDPAGEKTKGEAQHASRRVGLSPEVQPRLKHRPISAIFLESLKDQRCSSLEDSEGKSPTEKSWVRKPRPLSMDLTAKFENKDISLCKKTCLADESKENAPVTPFTDTGSCAQSETASKSAEIAWSKSVSSPSDLKSGSQDADFLDFKDKSSEQSQKAFPRDMDSTKDMKPITAKDKKYPWESKYKSKEEQNELKSDPVTNLHGSEKSQEMVDYKSTVMKEGNVLAQKETFAVLAGENSANASKNESKLLRGGSVKRHINLFVGSENTTAPAEPEPLPTAAERENRNMSVQQRIKELTAETVDAKPGSLRRSLPSRPLSADLTKMFSSPVSPNETKPEKRAELNSDLINETQANQKSKEVKPSCGADISETCAVWNQWKPWQALKIPDKTGQMERKGSFLRDRQNLSFLGENSAAGANSFETQLTPSIPAEKTQSFKTVRATMYDSNVEKHNIFTDRLGVDSTLKLTTEREGKDDVATSSGHHRRSWVEKELQEETLSKKEHHRQSHMSGYVGNTEKCGKASSHSEDKKTAHAIPLEKYSSVEKCEKPTAKHVEDSLMYQRIEPRYEILQTVGERALSEAITVVPEDKAVTLRTRKSSMKEKRKPDGDVLQGDYLCRLDNKTDHLKDPNARSETKDPLELSADKFTSRELKDFFPSKHVLPEQIAEPGKSQANQLFISEKLFYSISSNRDLAVTSDKVTKGHPEMQKEKNDASSAEKTESSKMTKYFLEKPGIKPVRADDYESRADVGQGIMSPSVSKQGGRLSVTGGNQMGKSPMGHYPDGEVISIKKEESRAFELRKYPDSSNAATENGDKFRLVESEEKVQGSSSLVSHHKVSGRWRRKTLPQDRNKLEVGAVTQESAARSSGTDSLLAAESAMKKKSKKTKDGIDPKEANQTIPVSPDDPMKKQISSSEPKATYFAVTYQVPGSKKEKSSVTTVNANETSPTFAGGESLPINPASGSSRRSKPTPQQPYKHVASARCKDSSQDVCINRNWTGEDDQDNSSFSKKGALNSYVVAHEDNSWKQRDGGLDCSKEKVTDVDALLKQEPESTVQTDLKGSGGKASPCYDSKSTRPFKHVHKDNELSSQKKSGESTRDVLGTKAEDHFRARILDIDALMAEYKDESMRTSHSQDRKDDRLPVDNSLFNWEKSKHKRSVTDKTPHGQNRKERKESDLSSSAAKQGNCAEEHHRPRGLLLCESSKEKLESRGQDLNKPKSKDRLLSPPYWGNPSSWLSDKPISSSADAASTRKKTFIIDEDHEKDVSPRRQSAKHKDYEVQLKNPVSVDQKLEGSLAFDFSSEVAGSLQKKWFPSQQLAEVSVDDHWHRNITWSSVNKSKAGANKTLQEGDFSHAKNKPERKDYMPSFGNTVPELKRSYSEKSRPAKARASVPIVQETSGRRDPHQLKQSCSPDSAESGLKQRTASSRESFCREDKKDFGKEWTKHSSEKSDGKGFTFVSIQRRSHSFYKDQRTERWTDQLKQCFARQPPEAKDTDALVQEADSQYGTWSEQRHSGDSFVPESPSSENNVISTRKQAPNSRLSFSSQTEPASSIDQPESSSRDQRSTSLDQSSTDMDSTDGTDGAPPTDLYPDEKSADFSFIDQTAVLDSSVLKTRVQLSKKRRRRAPVSHARRRSSGMESESRLAATDKTDSAWMFKDSTEEKSSKQEASDEEEKIHRPERSPAAQPQRLPVFPGMDPSVLKAQLRRRQEPESPGETGSAQLSKSPKPQFQPGAPGSRVLPSSAEREDRSEEMSPQWLKELKSKKRQSHYENQV
ncbi:uncharacterized protein KIAA1671 homolog isoform X1 [Alligator sinensis]|uniref:Uncharacterized protein KIAA1671 homolog isoform X1 n=1 Tax=Alligator sinensis TaxID=38654 RepID=A0A1U7RLU8_ALLSI|nr:uncharacterized protein KIAA1671 homolog isoform X1 [Alligator sinensis]XP_025055241.1 uncharacterized protein KIAA1671 homolog isoform X1 [Alligator sinensis]XP_025055251.1 uncharacterized protein KIAA1671 homolog isoform X1 [Alligator sinensis]